MERRVSIKWTETGRECLRSLPKKVAVGLLNKVDGLYDADPHNSYKPLKGPLQGYYSVPYSRYRALYCVEEETLADDSVLVHVKILFVFAGKRKDGDKKDVYRLAERLVNLGLLKPVNEDETDEVE